MSISKSKPNPCPASAPCIAITHSVGALAAAATLLLGGCGAEEPVDASAPPVISLQMDWYAQPEQAGFYSVEAHQLDLPAGIDIVVEGASPGFPFLQTVARGKADIGVVRADLIVQAVAQELPLVVVGQFMEHSPSGFMVPEDSPIQSFEDLDGVSFMGNLSVPYIPWIKQRFDIDFRLIPHNWDTAQFMAGEVDAQQCYVTSEPYYLAKKGFPVRSFLIADSGYDPPRIYYTSKKYLAENRELIRSFLEVTRQGWFRYFDEDPASVHALIAERNPKMSEDFMNWTRQVLLDRDLLFDELPRETWGTVDQERLDTIQNILVDLEVIDEAIPLEEWVDDVLFGDDA